MNLHLYPTPTTATTTIHATNLTQQPTPTIAFTTPNNYAPRLSLLIRHRNWTPLWCQTVHVATTSDTRAALHHHINHLDEFSAVAFTSRAGISAFSEAVDTPPLPVEGGEFIVAALGNDAQVLTHEFVSRLCLNVDRVKVVVPTRATPSKLIESLGVGLGRRVLCPVPLVVGLQEPIVVPNFLKELRSMGWVAVRVNAYETKWAGPTCAKGLLEMDHVDGLVFTSTAEVEGLLKSLKEYGLGWEEMRKRWPRLVVAAHGPVTAAGAESLGVGVDVVSSKFSSFEGVVEALDHVFTFGAN